MAGRAIIQAGLDALDLTPTGSIVLERARAGESPVKIADDLGLKAAVVTVYIKQNLSPDEMSQAREVRAQRLVDEAMEIADGQRPIMVEDVDIGEVPLVDSKRDALRVNIRTWAAERLDRNAWAGNAKTSVEVNLSVLHLDALRARAVKQDVIDV